MIKELVKYASGAAILILLILGIQLAISIKLLIPDSIVGWIGATSNPSLSLWLISGLISCVLITLIKLGIKLPFLKPWIEVDHPLFSYVFGLPLAATIPILLIFGTILAFIKPVCESPTATIDVTSLNDSNFKFDGRSVTAKSGADLTLEALVNENTLVFCAWSSTGAVINKIGPRSSCVTHVDLANKPGKGIITLTLSKSSCSVKSLSPLEIIVVP